MRFHPITMLSFFSMLFIMILIYSNPAYIFSLLIFLIVLIIIVKGEKKLKAMIRYGIYNVLIITAINPLLSREGQAVIFQSGRMPVIGRIKITAEALAYGANMGLKLTCFILIFVIFSMMTNKDDTFSFFSKTVHKLTITFSMSSNIIHRLKIEAIRVKEVMEMRGVNFSEKKLRKRIRAYYPLLKVIFISALEGSVDRAEALYSRGYGQYKRTSYTCMNMSFSDYIFQIISLMLLVFFLTGIVNGVGEYQFYPYFQKLYTSDFIWLTVLDFILILTLFYVWGCKRWKFLKYRI